MAPRGSRTSRHADRLLTVTAPSLAEVLDVLRDRFPESLAEDWDQVGLVCGDPEAAVRTIVFAVDPTLAIVEEAVALGADLLVTHHPLLFRAVHSVATTTAKGRIVHRLIGSSCALFAMHTNADSAPGGTNDTLASMLGLTEVQPLVAAPEQGLDKLTVFVPVEQRTVVADALFQAGAGQIGEYDSCAYWTDGTGQFRPTDRANPFIGSAGRVEQVAESRVEVVFPRARRLAVVEALRRAHPYEEPAFDVWQTVTPQPHGIGRLGTLQEPTTVAGFAARVEDMLPATTTGVRAAGDPQAPVRRVAICSGAGDSLLAEVRRTDADVYLTGDLRHHPVEEHLAEGGCPVVDVAHWASEWPWLTGAARAVTEDLSASGFTVEAHVSHQSTDPWSLRVGGPR